MEVTGALVFVALYCIGFLPMQRLKSRRATVISAILGLALVPIGLALLRAYPINLNTIAFGVFVFWMMIAGVAMTVGSAVRFYILGLTTFTPRDRRVVTAILGVALLVLMVAGFRALDTGLN
jgi:hypothetical protein